MPLDAPLPQIVDRHRAEFAACEAVLAFARSKFDPWTGRPIESDTIDVIVAGEASKATKTYRAGLMLASGGFGPQAMMLGRSLFEAVLVSHWVVGHADEALQLFNQHDAYIHLLWGEDVGAEGYDVRVPKISDDERTELTARFGRWGQKPWTRRTNYKLRMEVQHMWDDGGEQLGIWYRFALRESNLILHSSAWSIGQTMRVESTDLRFDTGPSWHFVDRALHFLLWSYSQIVGVVMDHFKMPDRHEFTAAFRRAHDAFEPMES